MEALIRFLRVLYSEPQEFLSQKKDLINLF